MGGLPRLSSTNADECMVESIQPSEIINDIIDSKECRKIFLSVE